VILNTRVQNNQVKIVNLKLTFMNRIKLIFYQFEYLNAYII